MTDDFILSTTSGYARVPASLLLDSGYTIGERPLEENEHEVSAEKRSFLLPGVAADAEYTVEVYAFRKVDPDIDPSRLIASNPSVAPSSPYQPSNKVIIGGQVVIGGGTRTLDDIVGSVVDLTATYGNTANSAANAAAAAASAATSNTAAANAATAQNLSEAARNAAQAARDLAGNYQQGALTAQNASEAARALAETAKIDAQAAFSNASAAQLAAGNFKAGAEAAKTAAETARDLANSSKTAAKDAQDAAETARNLALQAKTGADSSRDAAATSASTASTKATEAGNSATSATGSANTATTKASEANTSASAAASSATAAGTSSTNAGQSASSATISANTATTKAGEASTSANQSASSAADALGYRNTAQSSATLAANSATAAGNSATAANTSAGAASTSATNAGNSATAAQTSSVNAASSYNATILSLNTAPVLPSTFDNGFASWTATRAGNPSAVAVLSTYNATVVNDPDFGTAAEVLLTAGGHNVLTRGVVPTAPGRTYEIRARVKMTAPLASDGSVSMNIVGIGMDANYAQTNLSYPITMVLTAIDTVYELVGYQSDVASPGVNAWPADSKFIRYGLRLNSTETGHGPFRIGSIKITDVTEKLAAAASATASATSASQAGTSATNAGQSATAANASATNAATSAGDALTYSNNASTSASNAAGSANTATTQAGLATTAKGNAESAATAAQGSASTASTKASEAGTSATSASGSANTASTKASEANTSASAAAASATAANTSSTNAGQSASSATTSANTATTKAGEASTSASQSASSAADALGYRNSAQSSSELAAQSKTDAANSATAANTSAGSASTSATNAGNSATAANTSSVNAASSYSTVRSQVASMFPDRVSDGTVSFYYNGSNNSAAFSGAPSTKTAGPTASTIVNKAGFGFVWQPSTDGTNLLTAGVMPVAAGAIYEVAAEWEVVTLGSANVSIRQWVGGLDASYTYIAISGITTTGRATTGIFTTAARYATVASTGVLALPAGTAFFRPLYQVAAGPATGSVVQLRRILIRDITAQLAAEAQATAAATSATNAGTSATNAGTSATAASTSATNASTSAGNALTYSNNASTSATNAAGSANTATTQAGVATQAKVDADTAKGQAQGFANAASGSASSASSQASAALQSAQAADASKTAAETAKGVAQSSRDSAAVSESNALGSANSAASSATTAASSRDAANTSASAAATSASTAGTKADEAGASAASALSAKTNAETAAGNASTSAGQASTSASNALGSQQTASQQAGLAAGSATAAGNSASAANTSAGTASTQATNAGNSATAANTSAINAATSRDAASGSASQAAGSVTTSKANADAAAGSASTANTAASNAGSYRDQANTFASNANTSANNASASAASASTSATISSSYSSTSVNVNDKFANWTNENGYPVGWLEWASNGTYAKGRVASGAGSPYAVRTLNNTANVNSGFYQNVEVYPGKWVLTATAMLEANAWSGAGIALGGTDYSIHFGTEPDTNQVVTAVGEGATRTWSKLITITSSGTLALYAMHGYVAFGPVASKNMRWNHVGLRPANTGDIAGNKALADSAINAANITTLSNTVASATQSLASLTTTVEARALAGGNMLGNTDFPALKTDGWNTYATGPAAQTFAVNMAGDGWRPVGENILGIRQPTRVNDDDTGGRWSTERITVTGSASYCGYVQAAANRCRVEVLIEWYRKDGSYISATSSGRVYPGGGGNSSAGFLPVGVKTVQAPSDAATATLNLWKWNSETAGTDSYAWFWRPYFGLARSTQTEFNPYAPGTGSAILVATMARVTSSEAAVADIQGRTEAYAVKEVIAGMGAAFVSMRAKDTNGNYTSDVGIGASTISLYNQTSGGFKLAMQLSGGNAVFTGSLNVGTTIRLGSGTGWAVALAQRDFSIGDGETLTYGANLTNNPDFSYPLNGLAPLNTGEVYEMKMVNVTPTQATLSAKILTPGVNTSYVSQNPTKPGSGPTVQSERGEQPEANNGNYSVTCSLTGVAQTTVNPDAPAASRWEIYVEGTMDIWGKYNGVWNKIGQATASFQNGYSTYGQRSYTIYWSGSIYGGTGMTAIGVTANNVTQGTITTVDMGVFGWNSQASTGSRTALPSGTKTTVTVRPK